MNIPARHLIFVVLMVLGSATGAIRAQDATDKESANLPHPGSIQAVMDSMYNVHPGASYVSVNCVQWMDQLLRKAGFKVTPDFSKQVRIATFSKEEKAELSKHVLNSDPRTTGAPGAIVASGQGTWVELKKAAPGDIVQYWYNGGANGHTGVVETVGTNGRVTLYGSHKSAGGVGRLETSLAHASKVRVYVARPGNNLQGR